MKTKTIRTFEIRPDELERIMYKLKKESELRIALDTFLSYQKIQLAQLEKVNKIAKHLKDIKEPNDVWFKNIKDKELRKVINKGGYWK
jgi:hypothetical protein